jgi:Flp pilus assembly protein TadB
LHGWHGILLGLLGSVVFLISGRQDVGPGIGMSSSAFWFFLALLSTLGVIWLGIGARIWTGALLGLTFFCLEFWLIRRWRRQSHDPPRRQGF